MRALVFLGLWVPLSGVGCLNWAPPHRPAVGPDGDGWPSVDSGAARDAESDAGAIRDASADVVLDSGRDSGDSSPDGLVSPPCDLLSGSGCDGGASCAVHTTSWDASSNDLVMGCVPKPTLLVEPGTSCGFIEVAPDIIVDNCALGALCINGSCQQLCSVANAAACTGAYAGDAGPVDGVCWGTLASTSFDPPVMFCSRPSGCRVMCNDCGAGRMCLYVADSAGHDGTICVAGSVSLPVGSPCDSATSCVAGSLCIQGSCRRLCSLDNQPVQDCSPGACPSPQQCVSFFMRLGTFQYSWASLGVGVCAEGGS